MQEGFKGVPLKFFERLEKTSCDIYLRINDEKFVKIVNTGDQINKDTLTNYQNKNITDFYVTEEAYSKWGNDLTPMSDVPRDKNQLPTHKELNSLLTGIGVNQLTCLEVGKTYEKLIGDISKNPKLSQLLNGMVFNKKRFIYDHSYLTGVVAVELAKKSDWGVGATREKMTLASLMHDLKLDEDLATLADQNNLSNDVNIPIKMAHAKHSEEMSLKLMHEENIPDDVIKIVKDHHNLLAPHLTRLTMVFIVAHEFVLAMYKYQLNPKMAPNAFKDIATFFQGSDFFKYVEQLEGIVNK